MIPECEVAPDFQSGDDGWMIFLLHYTRSCETLPRKMQWRYPLLPDGFYSEGTFRVPKDCQELSTDCV